MKILVIEDDMQVAETLRLLFAGQSYATDITAAGETGLQMLNFYDYDLVVMDILLPDINGIRLCRNLRESGCDLPILLLTGLDNSHEKATGLNAGADDYVAKPFDPEELIARVHALLRRRLPLDSSILSWEKVTLDPTRYEAAYEGQGLPLTPKEFAILELFLRNPHRVFSAKTIVDQAWPSEEAPGEEVVRVHIKGLRQKLKAAGGPPDLIETVHRVGYRLNPAFAPRDAAQEDNATDSSPKYLTLVATLQARTFQLMEDLLKVKGFQLLWHNSDTSLVSTLEQRPFNLAIIDAETLLATGFDLCRQIRQMPQGQNLPVLMLLPADWPEGVVQAFKAGASDVVRQPIVGPELVNRAICWLDKSA